MPLGWKVLHSYEDKIISDFRGYDPAAHEYHNTYWTPGEWNTVDGVIVPCRNGLHMSPTPGEAWAYVAGDILALVEGAGISINSSDENNYPKSAHSQMRIIRAVVLPRSVRRKAIVKYDEDLGSYPYLYDAPLPDLHKTDAYLRQVFKELPAIKPVQQ